ncbi:MAG: hypothetical protein WBH01_04030 [Dehalococcoidia bacterium]
MKKLLVLLIALLVVAMGFPGCETEPTDITPPTTTQKYGQPYYTDGVGEWITAHTEISLDATDDDSGVDYTRYRVWYNGEWTDRDTDWFTYTGPFTMGEIGAGKDCLHKIEYYSVDNEGNEESWHEVMVEADAAELEAYSALAVDPFALRTTHVVYTEEGSQDLVYETSSDFGETWTGKTVLVSGLAEASEPDIQMAPNGDIHIVFVGYLPGQQQRISHIWYDFAANNYSYDKATDPANWEARVLVDDTGRDNVYPQIATDSLNNVHCVWIGDSDGVVEGGAQDIFYSKFDGSSWSPRMTVYANATTAPGYPNPQIIADRNDELELLLLHVVFLDSNEHKMKYLMCNYTSSQWGSYYGDSWNPGVADNVGGSSASYGVVAGMAIEGTILHITWQDVRDGDGEVYENTRDLTTTDAFGSEWPITLYQYIDDDGTSVGETLMASGESDSLHLFYRDSVGYDVWYMEYHSAWSEPVIVADSGPDRMHLWPEMAVDNFDSPLLTYTKATNDDAEFGVYYKKPYHNQIVRVDNTPPKTTKTVSGTTVTLESRDNCHCEKYAILVGGNGRTAHQREVIRNDLSRAENILRAKWTACATTGKWDIMKFTESTSNKTNVREAFSKVAAAANETKCCLLYFYFVDHGDQDPIQPGNSEPAGSTSPNLDEYLMLKSGEKIYDDEFAEWVSWTCKCVNTVIVIEACHSGGFIPDIKAKKNTNIEIFTSTDEEGVASFDSPTVRIPQSKYSRAFHDALAKCWAVEAAHNHADATVRDGQKPQHYDHDKDEPKFLHCCGVGSYQIHYRISYDGEWGPEQVGELNEPVSFKLTEPCEYIIEYWAVDNLGNEEEHDSQSHTVVDHFKCYFIDNEVFLGDYVYLEDQFGAVEAMVDWAWFFCNPVEMWHDEVLTPISHPDHHLTLYGLDYAADPQTWFVTVDNQFGIQELTVYGPSKLAVPTQKVEPGAHEPPVCLDHFLVYKVIEGPSVDVVVGLNDQFGDQPEVLVTRPAFFANPVRKTHGGIVTEIEDPEAYLVFYEILGDQVNYPHVQVVDQFGEQTFAVYEPYFLAVPSEKLSAE